VLILLPVMIGVGYATGGRLRHLADLHFRALFLLAAGIVGQTAALLALGPPPNRLADAVTIFTYGALAVWLVLNLRDEARAIRAGLVLVLVGWLLNFVVIVPNHGMPVSSRALREIGSPGDHNGVYYKHIAETDRTFARPLGDVIPVRVLRAVVSLGDLVLFLGLGLVVAAGMHRAGAEQSVPTRG
jgi:hypothetical protein